MSKAVRVLVIDDSPAMCRLLSRLLAEDPDIEVVGCAPEPNAARQMIRDLQPDVLTLDVEMPGMDGLSFLERIMRLHPMPVVMCSTLTARGTHITIEALRLGAVDCIAKPQGSADVAEVGRILCLTVKAAAQGRVRRSEPTGTGPSTGERLRPDMVIGIGASTGGVEALFHLLPSLPASCPPVLVVQHMPAAFTSGFAQRLDKAGALQVHEARHDEPVLPGHVYVAPGGSTHMSLMAGNPPRICLEPGEPCGGHRPAVNVLFRSLARLGNRAVGVILTGMGEDGAAGLLAMQRAGARTFGQSADTCVVYGMPRAAAALGAVQRELALAALPSAIAGACRL